MVATTIKNESRSSSEAGYILLGVLVLIAIFVIFLAVAAPIVAKDIERDKEVEAVHRGQQYKHAIKMYYKKFGAYPVSVKQLEETNNIRFLRKRYLDPMTGKDDWRLIHVGEAKVPVMGFFGQPLQGGTSSTTTGLANNGTGGLGGGLGTGSTGIGGSSSFGNSSFGGSGSSLGGSSFGSSPSSSGSGDATAGAGAGAPAGVMPGMSGGGGAAAGGTVGSTGTTVGGAGTGASGASAFNGSTLTGSGGSGFDGGGPIVGVGIPGTKKSLVVYKKQDVFNKWEFTYDPIEDQNTVSSSSIPGATGIGTGTGTNTGGGGGSPFSNTGQGGNAGNSPFGSNNGSSTTGSPAGSSPAPASGNAPPN